ncbi:hypothetical protein [Inhella proteolytica]|uniref:Lipoprotein n=1 Tax=Inhella proteolytica TaxID=2795029 RepID=A0A931J3Q4_9BURK|nr:hypothetical protein [Inhella proteolytica]MBH9577183.1 hypothetical protein [Inhella proteolytica]
MKRMLGVVLALSLAAPAVTAACFNSESLGTYPASGVEVYFDLHFNAEADEGLDAALKKAGANPTNLPLSGALLYKPDDYPHRPQFVGFVPLNHMDPTRYDAKSFKAGESRDHFAVFYERDAQGKRRVCRVEEWRLRHPDRELQPEHVDYVPIWREPSLAHVPVLKAMAAKYIPRFISTFHYDAQGRLREWRQTRIWEPQINSPEPWRERAGQRQCFFYGPQGRLERFVAGMRKLGTSCAEVDRLSASSQFLYRYDASGRYIGSVQQMGASEAEAREGNLWSEIYRLETQPGHWGEAESDNLWGLRWVTGLPQIENVSDHRLHDSKLAAIYRFPQPTPTSVMDGLPHSVKAYRRVRIGPATASGTVSEMFPPNGGITERIFSRNAGGNVFRHERFNAQGKVYQVINDGLMSNDPKEKTKIYDEDWDALDQALAHPRIKVPRAHVRLRVYEVGPDGQHQLKALSWSKALPPEGPSSGRGGPLKDLFKSAKKAWTQRGKPPEKPPSDEELRVRYTDLQGREIWRDWDAFLKATGFIEFEQAFYPHGHPVAKEAPINWSGPPIQ